MMGIDSFKRIGVLLLLAALFVGGVSLYIANAIPEGATISGSPSVDTGPTRSPGTRNDLGGRIITLTLNTESQDYGWKAYIGNVSGQFVLQNTNNMSIYEWPSVTAASGELYVSRNNSLNFAAGAIICANSTQIATENAFLGFSTSARDNINGTFNVTSHAGFQAGAGNPIPSDNCSSTALWVNNTAQTPGSTAIFQEILLSDHNSLIYVARLNDNQQGFDNTSLYDFQIIIPENKTATSGTPYYFYLELDS
jgi:hypothetical protein